MARSSRTLSVIALAAALVAPSALQPVTAVPMYARAPERAPTSEALDTRRDIASERSLAVAELRARIQLGRSLGQGVLDLDPRTGTIRVLARLDGFLSPPSDATASRIVIAYVRSYRRALGLDLDDLRTFVLVREFADLEGTRHLSWVQRAGGTEAFDNGLKASVTADGRIVAISGSPAHGLGRGVETARPVVTAAAAITAARAGQAMTVTARSDDSARLVLFHGARSVVAWETLTHVSGSQIDLSVVDATTGKILWRANMVKHEQTGTGLAWESYPSTAVPNGGGTQQPISFPVKGTGKLSGNNAHVYLDTSDDDEAHDADEIGALSGLDWSVAADLNTTRTAQNCKPVHACTWNSRVAASWKANRRQSAVQTYYYLNRFHDHLASAPIGFREATGNFQATNTSGKGKGGDAVQAQVFDGAGTDRGLPDPNHYNNANMFTRPDGRPPIMQMYLFREDRYAPGWPSANAGDDASVVYHEYTHGLSSRLVTYPNGWQALNGPQSGAMGEAWSDWYAMDLLVEEGWENDTNAPGEVIVGEYITGGQGIRYQAIDCTVGAPSASCPSGAGGGPGGFTYGDFGAIARAPEVHADGEIWAQTLWDLRRRLGVVTSRAIVTRGMMLSPPEPSFLDMRNAIVQADRVINAGANADAIWKTFARRGMGFFAASLGSSDTAPVENFKVAPDCSKDPCGTLKGRVFGVDGAPLGGAAVGLAGLTTGFPGARFIDVTGSDGRYSIPKVPFGSYRGVFLDRRGYDVLRTKLTVDEATESRSFSPVRDWAAADGGGTIVSFSKPDYSKFGCGPSGAIDRSLATGWGSITPGPRQIVIRLARTIDISSFGVDPGATCGDFSTAGTETFDIYTRRPGGSWVLAWRQSSALPGGRLNRVVPSAGTRDVRYVRFVMKSNRDRREIFLDMSELSVRGTPA
ncbi:MAG: M36 family metallopeptidase [Actinomycetota bacterium]